jgi:CHASE1-domain containing sensor protein
MRRAKPSKRIVTWFAVLIVVAVALTGLGAMGYLSFASDEFVWSAPGR